MEIALYLILFEHIDALKRRTFRTTGLTYDKWEDADEAAKEVAKTVKARCWVCEIPRPSLIQLAN